MVTFVLLEITALFSKSSKSLIRFVIASLIGGLYSMIIFVDELPSVILFLSKILSCFVIIFVAFKYVKIFSYIKSMMIFLFSSVICLGVVILATIVFNLPFISINNSVLYFDVSSSTIIVCAVVAYIASSIVLRLYNRTLSKNELFTLIIENKGKTATLLAFMDTGNRLREPFSNMPVILVKKSKAEFLLQNSKIRMIPVTTVNNTNLLIAFKPEKIILKTSKGEENIQNAYIALSDSINDDNFSAILNYDILSI